MGATTRELTHAWGNLSNLTSSLIWAKYGYWAEHCNPPDWYDNELERAETAADIVQEPDVKYEVIFQTETPGNVTGTFRCWDANNLWVEPWEVNFLFKSVAHVNSYYHAEYIKHKELHSGVINALIHYKNTGEPVEPEWLPRTNSSEYWWLKKDYKPENRTGYRTLKRQQIA